MKRKFINGLLMAALSVASIGSFVSCTDHTEDDLNDLKVLVLDQNATLADLIANFNNLQGKVDALDKVKCDCGEKYEQLQKTIDGLLTIVNNFNQTYLTVDGAKQLFYTKTEINELLAGLTHGDTYTRQEVIQLIQNMLKDYCTQDQVNTIINQINQTIVEQVTNLVQNYVGDYVTKQEIENIINQYITNNQYITREDVTNIVNNFLHEYYTKEEITNILKNYITNEYLTNNYYTKEEIVNLLNSYVTPEKLNELLGEYFTKNEVINYITNQNFMTKEEVTQLLTQNYFTKSEILSMLQEAGLSEQQVRDIIERYMQGVTVLSEAQIRAIIVGYGYLTEAQINQKLEEYAKKSDLITETQVYTLISNWVNLNLYSKQQIDNMFAGVYSKTQIDNMIANLITQQEVLNLVETKVDSIKNVIINNQFGTGNEKLTIDQLVDRVVNLNITSCTCAAELQNIKDRLTAVEGMQTSIEGINNSIAGILTRLTTAEGNISNLQTTVSTIQTDLSTLQLTVNSMKPTVDALQPLLNGLQTLVNNLDALNALAAQKDNLNALAAQKDNIIQAIADATYAKNTADANKALIDALTARVAALEAGSGSTPGGTCNCDLTTINNKLTELEGKVTTAQNRADAAYTKAEQVKTELLNELTTRLNNYATKELLNTKITEVNNAITAVANDVKDLKDDLSDLKDQVDENADAIEDINDRLNDMLTTDDVKELINEAQQAMLAKQVTSVIVQGTENPIIGEAALPIGFQTNILAAHYGYAKTQTVFPSLQSEDFYASKEDYKRVTSDDMDMIGIDDMDDSEFVFLNKDQLLVADGEDNAGTLYASINPTDVDFTGVKFSLVNSLDQNAGIELGAMKKSNHKLTFGYDYTRGGGNVLYEAPAKLTRPGLGMPDLDVASAKEAASALKTLLSRKSPNQDRVNASTIAKAVAKNLRGFDLDRYALKATWKDPQGAEHSTVSDFGLAGLGMRGVPYGFGRDFEFDHVPGIDRIEDLIGDLIDGVNIRIPKLNIDIPQAPVINHLTIKELSDDMIAKFIQSITVDTTLTFSLDTIVTIPASDIQVTVPGQTVEIESKDITVKVNSQTITVNEKTVKIDGQEVKSYLTDANGNFAIDANGDGMFDNTITHDIWYGSGTCPTTDFYLSKDLVDHISGGFPCDDNNNVITAEIVDLTNADASKGKVIQIGVTIINPAYNDDFNVTIPEQTITAPTGTFTVTTEKMTVTPEKPVSIHIQLSKGIHFSFVKSIDMRDALVSIYNDLKNPMADVNKLIDDLQGYLDDMLDMVDGILSTYGKIESAINDAKNTVKTRISDYLDKINDRLYKYMTPNKWLQPVIFVGGNNFSIMSQSKKAPTRMASNSFRFVASSYTAELLAPAYKKFIAVTNVYNSTRTKNAQVHGGELKAALDAVNARGDMKKVVSGERQLFQFSAPSTYNGRGYIYEILYMGLDYNGKIAARKFYVKVK